MSSYNPMFQMSTGASSGMDWGSMVDSIIAAKRKQYEPLETKKEVLELKIGLFNEMNTNFRAVKNALEPLTKSTTYTQKEAEFVVYSPSGVDASNIISATPEPDAQLQSWDIDIQQLAVKESRISDRVSDRATALGLAGSFYINAGGGRAKIDVASTDTLLDINYKITNATDVVTGQGLAINSRIIDNRLVLSSLETGTGGVQASSLTTYRGDFVVGVGGTDYLARTPQERYTKGASNTQIIGNPDTGVIPPSVTVYQSDGTTAIPEANYTYSPSTGELTWSASPPAEGDEYVVKWDYPPYVSQIETATETYENGVDFTYNDQDGTINWLAGGAHPEEREEYVVHFSDAIAVTGTGAPTTNILAHAPNRGFPPLSSTDPMEITVGSNTYTEGDEFTFNRTTGVIDWSGGATPNTEPVGDMTIKLGNGQNMGFYQNVFSLEKGTGDNILSYFNLNATEEGENWVKAQDAILELDGVKVTRSSNTIDDLIGKTTLELKSVGHVSMDIVLDTEDAILAIQDFITAYNDAMDWINVRLSEEEEVEQGSDTWQTSDDFDKKFGLLHGNSMLWQAKNRLRQLVSDPIETLGPLSMLSQIGITTEEADYGKSGELVFDQTAFMDALTPEKNSFFDTWMTDALTSSTEPLSDIRASFAPGDFSVTVGGKKTTITVEEGDTLTSLAQKINNAVLISPADYLGEDAPIKAKLLNNTLAIICEELDEDMYIQDTDGVLKSLGLDVTLPDDADHHVLGTEYYVEDLMTTSMDNLMEYVESLISTTSVSVGSSTAPDGRIASEIYFMQNEISYIDKRIDDYERRISLTEERLWKQYSAAEQAISLYNAQLTAVSQFFDQYNNSES